MALCRSHETYLFFERPGYWLRVAKSQGALPYMATVMPEEHRVGRPELGRAGYWIPFSPDMLAPAYRGKGAVAKAHTAARELWLEHEGYLANLGIELTGVGAKMFRGSGRGGYVAAKYFRKGDLFET